MEPDPIELEGGLNPYIYADSNPLSNVDPSGLDCIGDSCSDGFEQGMYDWWPDYKFGTDLYNSFSSRSNQFSLWEGFDGLSFIEFNSAKALQTLNRLIKPLGISTWEMTSPTISRAIIRESEPSIITTENFFFQKSRFIDKVKIQASSGDYHAFPQSVDSFAASKGKLTSFMGGDKNYKLKLEIQGSYHGKDDVFEYIRNYDGAINHCLFIPNNR